MITLTENAQSAVRRFIESAEEAIVGLRIKVEGGGCSGFQYGMKLEQSIGQDDQVVEYPGVKVVVMLELITLKQSSKRISIVMK